MKVLYELTDGTLTACTKDSACIVVYAEPDEAEKQELMGTLGLTRHDVDSALDPDEISRVEFSPDRTYIIWKRPNNVTFEQQLKFEVSSVGLFLQKDRLTFILGENTIPFEHPEFRRSDTLNRVVLKFILYTIHHYFGHLKVIKQLTAELQAKLNVSMENRYLLQMFALGESLIYYLNALEANASVLAKLRGNAERMGLTKDETDMLDDVMIEQQQCSRQTQIYNSVLSGLMDARASIVNNNMNVLLRNLTVINIVFMPLNLIAGIGGMSEFSMMTGPHNWPLAYALFFIITGLIGWGTWYVIMRKITAGLRVRVGKHR